MNKRRISWLEIQTRLQAIDTPGRKIYGVPRGGAVCACLLRHATRVMRPEDATLILDDIIDSGETKNNYALLHPHAEFFGVIDKLQFEEHAAMPWVVFPWESENEDEEFNDLLKRVLTRFHEMYGHFADKGTVGTMSQAFAEHDKGSVVVRHMMIFQQMVCLGDMAREQGFPFGQAVIQGINKFKAFTELKEEVEDADSV